MDEDIKSFFNTCLHCLCTQPGTTVIRPLGHALPADVPNEFLHFDFCYMSPAEEDFLYMLILKDDHSRYVCLVPTTETTAQITAGSLIKLFAAFGVFTQWVSDGGSHLKKEVVLVLKEKKNSSHHFTLAYCPWSNGTVEDVSLQILRVCIALLSGYQLPQICWPSMIPVQSDLNNSIIYRLGNRCPLTVFTGHKQDTPLNAVTRTVAGETQVLSVDEIRLAQLISIKVLQDALQNVHKDLAQCSTRKKEQAVDSHNRKTGVRRINFLEGDFVLRDTMKLEWSRKPSLQWNGPFRILKCRWEYIFLIESLLDGKTSEVHFRMLKCFHNKDYNVTEELLDHLSYWQGALLVMDHFMDVRRNQGSTVLLVKWRGYPQVECDWVKLSLLREDVPILVEEYLSDIIYLRYIIYQQYK